MSRRDHTAHDLASLRIDLFGETAKPPFADVFGRKAKGTVDKRGNVLATAPFKKRKRKTTEKNISTQEKRDVDESIGPRKKRRTYYPSVLPYLNIPED